MIYNEILHVGFKPRPPFSNQVLSLGVTACVYIYSSLSERGVRISGGCPD